MVGKNLEYRTEEIEVGTNIFRTVDYAFEPGDGKVTIYMRYAGKRIDPFEVWGPLVVDNFERALTLVTLWARWLYEIEQEPGD